MTDQAPPDGFTLHERRSPLTDPWQPIYMQETADRMILGLYLREVHTNARGSGHGGFLAALADNSMGYSSGVVLRNQGREFVGLSTVSLSVDYIGAAHVGQWITFNTDTVETTGSLCFARQMIRADKEPIARANTTFKILKPK